MRDPQLPTIAAFDFDGTITYRDTMLPFAKFTRGSIAFLWRLLIQLPCLIGFATGKSSRQDIKEKFLSRFFKGIPTKELRTKGELYAKGPLMKKLKPAAVERLRWHQSKGHRCILISANLDVYLEPWRQEMGFDNLICSQMAHENGIISGKIIGENCWGEEKCRRLKALLGEEKNYLLYAYGDSKGDYPLLEMADFPFYNRF